MTAGPPGVSQVIWATRGRTWGFRFLLNGGLSDPLPLYDEAFGQMANAPSAWVEGSGHVALRFPDPMGRRDTAGRLIPHEFIVPKEFTSSINSVESGVHEIWPLVSAAFARFWDNERPPSNEEVLRVVAPHERLGGGFARSSPDSSHPPLEAVTRTRGRRRPTGA